MNNQIELALYVINLKKASIISNNSCKTYIELKNILKELENEREEIYKKNGTVINKVLDEYLPEIRMEDKNV